MKEVFKKIIFSFFIFALIFASYLFLGSAPRAKDIEWGINFSQKQARDLGLDWQKTYDVLLTDLGAKRIKLASYWDLVEPKEGQYDFDDLDWQINEAEKYQAEIILVLGLKTPRWPECHAPEWAKNQKPEIRNQKLLEYVEAVVKRYRGRAPVVAWQVENEPFLFFGECPKIDWSSLFLKKEVELVKSLDNEKRPVIISDSGEWSFWFGAAKVGDQVGTTLYKKVWFREFGRYFDYRLPPVFYWRRAQLIKWFFNKDVKVLELQAEPWCPNQIYNCSLAEQEKTMSLTQLKKNIDFARKTGLNEFYFWGAEWWHWLKEEQDQPAIWQEVKRLF